MGAKILLVEDEQELRQLYAELLIGAGYQVEQAADGQTAIDHLRRGGFDLVLLDHKLPKMSGIEILKKLQIEYPNIHNGPILILTNMGDDSIISEAIQYGAKDCLIKADYTPEQLLGTVKKHLQNPSYQA